VVAYNSKNIRDALDVPLMVCRLCYEGMRLCPGLIKKANTNLISDVAVAAVFFESAYSAALFNVDANLKTLGDDKLTRVVYKELLHKRGLVEKTRRRVEEKIGKVIRG
jgi:formiminotetrahydrofolate cyclodeaminase